MLPLQLDGWRYIPTNFTSGKPVATMLTAGGKPTTVTVTLKTKDNIGSAFVTGGNAKTSEVIAPNLCACTSGCLQCGWCTLGRRQVRQ